jgi:hypothetical protein
VRDGSTPVAVGRLDPRAGHRLDATSARLAAASADDLARVRAAEVGRWTTRFEDLLADCPEAEGELLLLVRSAQGSPADRQIAPVSDHSLAALRDVSIGAASHGMAAGVMHGNVTQVTLDVTRRETVGRPFRLATLPMALAGREALLDRMHLLLTDGNDPGPRVVALSGMAGVGKTSLAGWYARA